MNIGVNVDLAIPVTGFIDGIAVQPFSMDVPIDLKLFIDLPSPIPNVTIPLGEGESITVNIPKIVINRFDLTGFNVGNVGGIPFSRMHIEIINSVGPISVPILHIPAAPGVGNSTINPTSGFFNSGTGGGSGFFNAGQFISGFSNQGGRFLSGVENIGQLTSGMGNIGSIVTGWYNTSTAGLTGALLSGIGNVGSRLAGFLLSGTGQ